MKGLKLTVLICLVAILASCTLPKPYFDSMAVDQESSRPEIIGESLFNDKDRTISEEDIQRLLSGQIQIPDTVRIAVYKYAGTSVNRYYDSHWSNEEFLKTEQRFLDSLLVQLEPVPRVKRVFPVPAMLTKRNPSVTHLRESAVRLQADLLLVFSVRSDTYYKYKALQKNESKAFATCESILLDTRTGVIPHSNIVTREKLVAKEKEDWTNQELRKRAENGAVELTLIETGKRVAEFLRR